MSYTKGPWIAVQTSYTGRASAAYYIEDSTGRSVAHIKRSTMQPMHDNALLIAASPKLLKALEQIVADWEGEEEDVFNARAAIAEARGKP